MKELTLIVLLFVSLQINAQTAKEVEQIKEIEYKIIQLDEDLRDARDQLTKLHVKIRRMSNEKSDHISLLVKLTGKAHVTTGYTSGDPNSKNRSASRLAYKNTYSLDGRSLVGDLPKPTYNITNGQFSSQIDNLKPGTAYYLRAYATNKMGTSYGEQKSFRTEQGTYISFTNPYQNELIDVGQEYTIKWETNITESTKISLEYWRGNIKTPLANAIYLQSTFAWSVPEDLPISTNNKIVMFDYNTLEVLAESPYFSINGNLELLSPANNSLHQLDECLIKWKTNDKGTLRLELYDGSQKVCDIAKNVSAQNMSYVFDASKKNIQAGTNYRVKIISEQDPDIFRLGGVFELVESATVFIDPRDNKKYKIVTIDNLSWFAQDLNYRDQTTYQISSFKNVCPSGWRVPTDADWTSLEKSLGMLDDDARYTGWRDSGDVGMKLKSVTSGGTDEIGLNINTTTGGTYATSTPYNNRGNCYRQFQKNKKGVYRNYSYGSFRIRCVRDN